MGHRVLLLNASFEPHSIIRDRDAVCLLLDDLIETVEPSDQVMRSPSTIVEVPSVARLKRYVTLPNHLRSVMLTRAAVCARDNHTCAYCRGHADTMDHVTPRARGGPHTWENVVAACRRCNQQKGDRLLADLGWELHREPYRPVGVAARLLAQRPEPAWRAYLAAA